MIESVSHTSTLPLPFLHFSLQYLTSSQSLVHFFRQVNGLIHTRQVLNFFTTPLSNKVPEGRRDFGGIIWTINRVTGFEVIDENVDRSPKKLFQSLG